MLADSEFGYTQIDYLDVPPQALKSASVTPTKLSSHDRYAVLGDLYLNVRVRKLVQVAKLIMVVSSMLTLHAFPLALLAVNHADR